MRISTVFVALVLLFSTAGCKKNIQTNEAVRDAIVKHLSARTDLSLSTMDVEVSNVTFSENEAVATVAFKPKGGPAEAGMSMRYTLEKKGNEWAVKAKADSGMGSHGGMGGGQETGLPPNHPPMGAPAK